MKPVIFLRLASVLTFIHAVLHTIGSVFGKPDPGPQQAAVSAMQTNQFVLMGLVRSYWSFYMGLSLAVSILLIAEAVAFWQLSLLAKTNSYRLRPIFVTFFCSYLAIAVNSSYYFFAPPVIAEALIALFLGLAFLTSKTVTTAN
jgi:hypothetical protein